MLGYVAAGRFGTHGLSTCRDRVAAAIVENVSGAWSTEVMAARPPRPPRPVAFAKSAADATQVLVSSVLKLHEAIDETDRQQSAFRKLLSAALDAKRSTLRARPPPLKDWSVNARLVCDRGDERRSAFAGSVGAPPEPLRSVCRDCHRVQRFLDQRSGDVQREVLL